MEGREQSRVGANYASGARDRSCRESRPWLSEIPLPVSTNDRHTQLTINPLRATTTCNLGYNKANEFRWHQKDRQAKLKLRTQVWFRRRYRGLRCEHHFTRIRPRIVTEKRYQAKTVVAPLDRVKILFQASNPEFQKYAGASRRLLVCKSLALNSRSTKALGAALLTLEARSIAKLGCAAYCKAIL